jgi:hypothetical protein
LDNRLEGRVGTVLEEVGYGFEGVGKQLEISNFFNTPYRA